MLGRRLGSLYPEHPSGLLIPSPGSIIVLRERVILGLCFFHHQLRVLHSFFRIQAGLLPMFPPALRVVGQLVQVFVHLVEGQCKLYAIVRHTLVNTGNLVITLRVGALPIIGPTSSLVGRSTQLLQTLRMLLLQCRPLLEESREVLSFLLARYRTRAEFRGH